MTKGSPCPCSHGHSIFPTLLQYQPSALGIQNPGWLLNTVPGAQCQTGVSYCLPIPPQLHPHGHSGCSLRKVLSWSSEETILHFFSNDTDKRRQVKKESRCTFSSVNLGKRKKDANSPGGEKSAECQQTDAAHCCCLPVPPLQPGQAEPGLQGFRVPQALPIVNMPWSTSS